MKKTLKKTLSLILSLMMIMSMFSGLDVISLADFDISNYLSYEIENEDATSAAWNEPASDDVFIPASTTIEYETTTYPDITEDYYPEESTTQQPSEPSISLGDVTDDGNIAASDARLALRVVVGLNELSEAEFYAADVDKDGVITSNDARLILRVAAKLNNNFDIDYSTTPSTPLITMYYTENEENPQEITVHVFASYSYDTCSGDVRFAFDSSVLEFSSLSFNYDNVSLSVCNSIENEILASFLLLDRAKSDAELCTITFNRLTDASTEISFESINWFGTYVPESVSLYLNTPGNAPAVPEIPTQAPPTTEPTTKPSEPVTPIEKKGDLNYDEKITAADARTVLRAVVDLEVLSETAFYNADVDEDGAITSNDARLILRVSAKLNNNFDIDYSTTPSTPLITMNYTENEENPQEITVHVYANNFYDTCCGDVRFTFDSSVLEFSSFTFNSNITSLNALNSTGNEILAAFIFLDRAATDSELFTITFNRLTDASTEISFESINWFGTYAPESVSLYLNTPGNAPDVPEIPTPSTPLITMYYTENEENPQEITVHVYVSNFYNTSSGDIEFAFDSSVLEFSSLSFKASGIALSTYNLTENEIYASFMFRDRAEYDSELCTITFNRLTYAATEIRFDVFSWDGTYAPESASVTINEPTSYDPALRYLEYYIYDDGSVCITDCDESASGELVIPATIEGYPVTSIDSYAFYGCGNITSITIPSGVTSMFYGSFTYCSGLERIIVDENNEYYSSDEYGALFNKDKTELLQYPVANKNAEYSIPESTTEIAMYAFENCSNLEILRIPENVSRIGFDALYNCTKLTDIYFGGSIAGWGKISRSANIDESVIIHIAKEAELLEFFDYYISDNQVTLADCFTTISGDITIPETIDGYPVTRFLNGLFYDCVNLTGITIPASVTEIDENVFTNCSSLAYIAVDKNNEYYTTDENGVLFNKDMTEILRYPVANSNTEYTIPDSVVTIGFMSFASCYNLESVIIGKNVKKINSEAFAGCSSLKNVSIPESVTIIEDSAFEYCSSLKSLTMPGFVSYIGCYAMGYKYVCSTSEYGASCYYTADEDFVIYGIPNSASERYAKECGIRFDSIAGESDNKPSDEKYLVVSDTCGTNLTWSLYSDGELIINGSGDDFKGHRPTLEPTWWFFRNDIVTVRIEHGITGIYSCSFRECSNLNEIYIPSTIKYISDDAFWKCGNIDTIYYEGSESEWNEIDGINFISYTDIVFNYEMPPMEEPPVEEPPVEEPPVEEPPVEEPPVEEPPVEEPPVEEPPVEEPPVEEPPVEEPADNGQLEVKGEGGIVTDFESNISQIAKEQTVATLSEMIENENFAIVDKNGNAIAEKSFVGTGSKIQILADDGSVLNEYTIIVPTDIDGNGKTTAADARVALRTSAQLDNLEGVYFDAADITGDGKITAFDARKILRIAANLEK